MTSTRHRPLLSIKILAGILLINGLWVIAYLLLGQRDVIISPWEVYLHLPHLLNKGLGSHLLHSLYRLLLSIPIALFLGVGTAWSMYRFKCFGLLMDAFTYLCYPIPKIALLPIVMLIAGLGDAGKITMIILIILFQIIVNVRDSLANIPKENFQIVLSLGANQWHILRYILLPAILPDILSTLRVAIGTSISVLFVTETYGTDQGMGYFIIDAWMRFNYPDMYGGIVVLSLLGFLLFLLTDFIEIRLCQWRESANYPTKQI